jgi:WD40 repeat protein
MKGRIRGLPNVVNDLVYSRDGALLAAALGSAGIRVFRTSDRTLVLEDHDYGDQSLSIDFDRRGRLVATCLDGQLRLYDTNLRSVARRAPPGGKQPSSARFSPDGRMIAVGFYDTTAVTVVDGRDLSFRYAPDTSGIDNRSLAVVAWSANGERLYAGGTYKVDHFLPLIVWDEAGKGRRSSTTFAWDTIFDIKALPAGGVVVGSGEPKWTVVDVKGAVGLERRPPIVEYRDNIQELHVSSDGARVRYGFVVIEGDSWSRRLARFDARTRDLTLDPPATDDALSSPRTSGLAIEGWRDLMSPTLSGKPLPLAPYEISRSLAIAADRSRFLLGTEWALRLFDRHGALLWRHPVEGVAFAVNLTSDGKLAVAALADGTIRWYAVADGRERLALLPLPDGKRWIAWTPEGFFAAAPGAETAAGHHLNHGNDEAADFVALDQLAELFHRPDLVAQALAPGGPKRIKEALARIGDARAVLAAGLPPNVEIPREQVRQEGDEVVVPVKLSDRGGGVGKLTFRVNGVTLEARSVVPAISGQKAVTVRLTLPSGTSTISVTGSTGNGRIESRPVDITLNVAPSEERPTLHVLAAGVTDYRDHSLSLKHASNDARAVAAALASHARGLFKRVNVPAPLLDRDVTYENLKRKFESLALEVKPNDVFVFYAAGHGAVRDGRYLFIPADLVYQNDETLRRDAIDEEKLRTLLAKIPAQKSLVLLDTCSAGAFNAEPALAARAIDDKSALDRLMKATGRAVLAAAGSERMALEGYQGHGVFTAALLGGLGSGADRDKDGYVDISELSEFIGAEVPRITKLLFNYEQFPQSRLDIKGKAFPIAVPP